MEGAEPLRALESLTKPLESVQVTSPSDQYFQVRFSITGMTCSACVRAISEKLEAEPFVLKANVVLLASSAVVDFSGDGRAEGLSEMIEDLGYGAVIEEVKPIAAGQQRSNKAKQQAQAWEATISIDGTWDASSATNIESTLLDNNPWINRVVVNCDDGKAIVEFNDRKRVPDILDLIDSAGSYNGASLLDLVQVGTPDNETETRSVCLQINGALDEKKLQRIQTSFTNLGGSCSLAVRQEANQKKTILEAQYKPKDLTIRQIIATVQSIEQALTINIYRPRTLEERAREIHSGERRRIIYRLILSAIAAIPSLIIGIVFMSLVPEDNPSRIYLMKPWANVSRVQWALLIIATPVYFCAADMFHRRAIKELIALWRPGSPTPIFRRLYRYGSMNLLICLGTSIAYFSSIAELIIVSRMHTQPETTNQSFYFDSVVFLTMFLLIGRLIEAWSRAKTADAVRSLGRLRPTTALLCSSNGLDKEKTDSTFVQKIPVDTIEFGDMILVPHGASPPCDGIILDGRGDFDESSLTGESRLISKNIGDDVFSGTVNEGSPIIMRVKKVVGSSMLDQIIQVVRDGQARRAPVERVGDVVTSYFVPVITAISITTWIIWLCLGETKSLPRNWLDVQSGGWPYWSLQFSIAVFIIACPCGFGLAAPTAMFVGGGIAAKNGILVKGGGEAFQEASKIDVVVFDKTGTLTDGGKPAVTDFEYLRRSHADSLDERLLHGLIHATEEKSSHPIASALVAYLTNKSRVSVHTNATEELAGRGLKGFLRSDEYPDKSFMVLVGNETLMSEHDIHPEASVGEKLDSWKNQGKSIVLATIRTTDLASSTVGEWTIQVIVAISDPIRQESAAVIKALQKQGIHTWMISGDNPVTASAVGKTVGILPNKIIAGVLPQQKAEMITYLQRSQAKQRQGLSSNRKPANSRAIVAMVGDGVNDSPALSAADIGIAIGSGSDVAISSADFVLISSDLTAVLTLIQLSRVVFRRIKFNFGWALVYNMIALPIAAGVLYPVQSGGSHIRLDPVWASLAMALSSISVVSSSLALKTKLPLVGFRKAEVKTEGR